MSTRTNTVAEAARYVAWLRLELGRELRLSRLSAGLRQQDVADRLGWSKSRISRMERGLVRTLSFDDVARYGAVVGLRPSVRLYPTGPRLVDRGQIELLQSLIARMSPAWRIQTEVPMPRESDLRAADLVAAMGEFRVMVEAYRRLADFQAQSRSATLKRRDLGADRLLLLIEDTHANRRALREAGTLASRSFPISARAMLAALAAGRDPGGDGIVLLTRQASAREPVRRAASG